LFNSFGQANTVLPTILACQNAGIFTNIPATATKDRIREAMTKFGKKIQNLKLNL
jgi:hypothetical protein